MKIRIATVAVCAAVLSLLVIGCHRGYYRRQADAEALSLIREKSCDPRWGQFDPAIDIDPRSRMFDPFSADHPPLPPDDPESHRLMEFTDCKPNYPHWHANGDTQYVENPEWTLYLQTNEEGELVLNEDRAVELALIHSTDYQNQKETLYISALDVSLERFGFDSQMALGLNGEMRSNGRFRGGANQLTLGNNSAQLQRLGITGSTLAIGLANSIMWNFAGPNNQSASTLINFSLIQPLLRGAGRDRIMESLTQSERTLLADVRQMDRYRRGFYLNVTTGRNPGQGPGGNFLSPPSGAIGGAGGFLGLLSDLQEIRIQERNVKDQQEILAQFRAFFEEQKIDLLQVTQVQSNLYNAQRSLAQSRNQYQDSLDTFKQTLGIPPEVPLVVDDPFLDQFELISDLVNQRRDEIMLLRRRASVPLTQINALVNDQKFDANLDVDGNQYGIRWSDELEKGLREIIPFVNQIVPISEKVVKEIVEQELEEDFAVLDSARPERLSSLENLREFLVENPDVYEIDLDIFDENEVSNSDDLRGQLEETLRKIANLNGQIASTIEKIDELLESGDSLESIELYNEVVGNVIRVVPELMTQLSNYVLEISLVQARARTDSILLPEVDLSWERAIAIARCFRRDWMNARAALVDQWRNIEFVADDLESQLDIVFEGEVGNVGDNPLKIRYENGSLGVGLRWDAPITRVSERNQYRQALINYQRTRRLYYEFKDELKRNIRESIRSLELNQILFELDRRSVRNAVQEVELARFALEEPTEVQGAFDTGSLGQQTARNLTSALNGLQQTQNQLLSTWVNYEAQRRGLDFDLGTMQMSPGGYWIDPGAIDETIADRAAAAMGIPCLSPSNEIDPYHVDYLEAEFLRANKNNFNGDQSDSGESLLDESAPNHNIELDDNSVNGPEDNLNNPGLNNPSSDPAPEEDNFRLQAPNRDQSNNAGARFNNTLQPMGLDAKRGRSAIKPTARKLR